MLRLFDLDHTLVHTLPVPVPGFDAFEIHVRGCHLFVHVRPHVLGYLEDLIHRGERWGIWTAGSAEYMTHVVRGLLQCMNVLRSVEDVVTVCLSRHEMSIGGRDTYIKDLSRFGKSDVLLYDDNRVHADWPPNKQRVVLVSRFNVFHKRARLDCFFLELRSKQACQSFLH